MISRSTVKLQSWMVGVCNVGSNWPGWKIAQSGGFNGESALQLGGGDVPSRSGMVLSSGVESVSLALKGGLPPKA